MRKSPLKAANQVPAHGQAKSADGQLSGCCADIKFPSAAHQLRTRQKAPAERTTASRSFRMSRPFCGMDAGKSNTALMRQQRHDDTLARTTPNKMRFNMQSHHHKAAYYLLHSLGPQI